MTALGINRRNGLIAGLNPRPAVRRANDKLATKEALQAAGLPVAETLLVLKDLGEVSSVWFADHLPERWVMKPNRGQQGDGIVIATEKKGRKWRVGEDDWAGFRELRAFATEIVLGNHAGSGSGNDIAFFEPLIEPHPELAPVSKFGLPDIRVIAVEGESVMAMLRMPTKQSGGRANLHQGALGLALDLKEGTVFRVVSQDGSVEPDDPIASGLNGYQVPCWDRVVEVAEACYQPSELGYLGAGLVIDRERGVLVLELNAHPGLEIQNVNREGLRQRIRAILGVDSLDHL